MTGCQQANLDFERGKPLEIKIAPLSQEKCLLVASTHSAYLNTSFKTRGGVELLKSYYEEVVNGQGGIGYIATVNDRFAGFVCGIWEPAVIRKPLIKKWYRLLIPGITHLLADPKYLWNVIARMATRLANRKNQSTSSDHISGYELRPLVVLPEFRGQGIADKLTEHLIGDALSRGFDQVFLFTEADNLPAQKFYMRFGFIPEKKMELHSGTSHAKQGILFRYLFSMIFTNAFPLLHFWVEKVLNICICDHNCLFC